MSERDTEGENKDERWKGEDKKKRREPEMEKWEESWQQQGSRTTNRHLLRRYSPPVSVDAIFEVEHSKPPNVHIQHVVIEDILWERKKYLCLSSMIIIDSWQFKNNLMMCDCSNNI